MKVYAARHGETTWNVMDKVCGRTDVPLTERGREQAKALAQKFRDRKVDVILSSPLTRAYETALAVSTVCGAPVTVDERLIEQDYGIYEGVHRMDPGFRENKRHFAWRYPGGESMMDLACRLYGLLEEVKEVYRDQTVLLVCHGGVCRVLNTYFRDMTNEEFYRYQLENCGIEEYEL